MWISNNQFILKMGILFFLAYAKKWAAFLSLCLKSEQASKTEKWSKCFAEQRAVLKTKDLLNIVLVRLRTAPQ